MFPVTKIEICYVKLRKKKYIKVNGIIEKKNRIVLCCKLYEDDITREKNKGS